MVLCIPDWICLQIKDLLFKFRCNRFVHKEIAELSKGGILMKFNYVNTNDNPVDLITRGESLKRLRHNSYVGFMVLPGWLVKPDSGLLVG